MHRDPYAICAIAVALAALDAHAQQQCETLPHQPSDIVTRVTLRVDLGGVDGPCDQPQPFKSLGRAAACATNLAAQGQSVTISVQGLGVEGGAYPPEFIEGPVGRADAPILIRGERLPKFEPPQGQPLQDYGSILRLHNPAYVMISGITIQNTNAGDTYHAGIGADCLRIVDGRNVVVHDVHIKECARHGILIDGTKSSNVLLVGNTLTNTVMHNKNGACKANPQACAYWDAASSTAAKGDFSCIHWIDNTVHRSWGEGIIALRSDTGRIEGNTVVDAFAVAIYSDSSKHYNISRNYCASTTQPTGHNNGIAFAEERIYADPGFQPQSINITNNIIHGVQDGIRYLEVSQKCTTDAECAAGDHCDMAAALCTNSRPAYRDIKVLHNTISNATGYSLRLDEVDQNRSPTGKNAFANNILNGPMAVGIPDGTGGGADQRSSWNIEFNLGSAASSLPTWMVALSGTNFAADPEFVSLSPVAPDDFKLRTSSPARASGVGSYGVAYDFFRAPRDLQRPSRGAYEGAKPKSPTDNDPPIFVIVPNQGGAGFYHFTF